MKLREIRQSRGLEQKELATRIGTDVGMVSRLENYKCLPTPPMMKDITHVLGCTIKDIYKDNELYFKRTKVTHSAKKRQGMYHISGYISASARNDVAKMTKALGYENISSWLEECYQELKIRYEESKEQ